MPDWSYHGIFRPVLKKIPPIWAREFIHRGMNMIASLPFGAGGHIINFLGREESSPLLEKEHMNISFKNIVGLSGILDPNLSGTRAFSNLGFGFLEIGPVTWQPTGNGSAPIVKEETPSIIFPKESIGFKSTMEKLKKVPPKQPLLIRLQGSHEEIKVMADRLEQFAAGFIVETEESLNLGFTDKPVLLSIKNTENLSLRNISCFSGLIVEETKGFENLKEDITRLRTLGFDKTIISSGGIHEPAQALELADVGADLMLVKEGYVFSGPGLIKRIKEAFLDEEKIPTPSVDGWFSYWLFGLFILAGGVLALLFSITSIILPYDEHFLGMKKEEIWMYNERIMLFMAHDRMTLAGTMISGGIVYMQLAKHGVRNGLKWAKQAIDLAAIVGFLGIFAFIGYGYFDWLHLLFWLILLPFYLYGYWKTKQISGTPSSLNRFNDKSWKVGVLGQLAFVLLGFSFVIGGIIISGIGVSSVFVATDIQYICMPPEMLESFNQNLIPVLAHDRAGFGSALLSVGLLVLTMALWGYQQGNKWVWWTFLIGGMPAFIAGIYIHFAIGYTTFVHLLPAYFALVLYILGLLLSYRFLQKISA
ncbi:dihydroorotate dehydrogenase [Sutcliffiella horikoshii]|uniref:dihydroorotate dehydrogenase n=1 Tax=Sutcliffiella horikoshii TaxID=79883 RepID=UPI00203F4837|nr:dihydroorotate dehydrogenase [Sutcliffiella horikoshii]MCM3619534.1 dihydroorotate dehydrogenase [Sutcliffiella horikoshii]